MEKWHKLKEFEVLVDKNDKVLRATKNNDTLSASIYRYNYKYHAWENMNGSVKFTTLKANFYNEEKNIYIIT